MTTPVEAEDTASLLRAFKEGIGAWLVGVFMTTFLVGMAVQQTFRYFRLYPRDAILLKAWVVLAVSLQMLTTALTMHTAYYYLVTYYFNLDVFTRRTVCYSFFRLVSDSLVVSVHTSGWISAVASSLLLAGDIQLTGVLIYALHRGRSGIRRTDSMIDILIAYTSHMVNVPTALPMLEVSLALFGGFAHSVLHIVSLILFSIFPRNIIFATSILVAQTGVYQCTTSSRSSLNLSKIPPVYTNSFIVARGELDNTNLDTKIVLGEGGPSDTAVDHIALDALSAAGSSMVFAERPSQFLNMEEWATAKVYEESVAPSSVTLAVRDERTTA
ncbi:hypothetical protein ONZ51_g2818 [Trametes cubensis]|uniref:Uncharacterized protein n=1 Tax=Trametes cubensis TaxID=1111947 RepID=A0AAD7TZ19_9APHY|nr:hypothetical protein ONZ51_g2818 [Trametes cubensis]